MVSILIIDGGSLFGFESAAHHRSGITSEISANVNMAINGSNREIIVTSSIHHRSIVAPARLFFG